MKVKSESEVAQPCPTLSDKRQPSEWEKIIANETTDKGLISKIYRSYNSISEKQTTQSKSGKKT